MKICPRCKEQKEQFSKASKTNTAVWCKQCTNSYYREWRKNNPKAQKGESKQFNTFYTTIKGRAVHMLNNCRARAGKKSLECNLTTEWIVSKLELGVCEATGLPLQLKTNGGKGHKTNSFSPSLERIDNSKGYTEDNCQITCWIYNRAKGAFPIADLLTMLKALELNNESRNQ